MKALIIGGGIIGSSIAWRLAADGNAVTVLERARLGQEASWAAAGLIGPQAEAHEPGAFFDLALAGKRSFDEIVERLTRESGVDPEYDRQGVLYAAFTEEDRAELQSRAKWQRAAGGEVEELTPRDALKLAPMLSAKILGALHMPTNWRVENRKLTQAYINAAIARGALFREGARVDSIVTAGGRATGVRLTDGSIETGDLVINAAGSWSGEIRGLEEDRIRFYPVRGQILCFDALPGLVGPSLFSADGIIVQRRDGRILAGSVFEEAGFNKSVTLDGLERVSRAARALAPDLASMPFREAWAGLRPASEDLLPVLGPSPTVGNVIYAAGHFRSGILLSAITGEVIADLAAGRKPSIDLAPFAPARFRDGIAHPVKLADWK
ncbi:MAG: glycine oxidase ThiO [Candidatus Binatus sp.]|uniref:glycine oxidase ThiO n=1 Tax=Candidatus Binatus sp. TaxID=2811406 RepID=UPI0027225CD4|nr:glycine oxidase ThiO [Candidatus Binatus sp.]MDO8434180.1 glycine oxidase ThiO [Candidatus Binatus sp.]